MAFSQSAPQTRIELSPQEMLAISQAISREFAPLFTARNAVDDLMPMAFSVQELLTISQEISREFSPRPVEHRSHLVLLPIDPHRLHVYWHLNHSSLISGLNTNMKLVANEQQPVADEQLTLRVFKQSPPAIETINQAEPSSWIDIPVDSWECRHEVILPAESDVAGATFHAEIGISHGKYDFTALAVSNAAVLPNPQLLRAGDLSDIIAQFSVPISTASSPVGKGTSHLEIGGSQ